MKNLAHTRIDFLDISEFIDWLPECARSLTFDAWSVSFVVHWKLKHLWIL